ncbi:nucleoside deaminase [Streptomyces scopuliridis]|uniref:nucleoside deaminase n=1 Tax=Streptomyces scopuliridis TaxID=452529 RepID=UPI00369EB6C6
MSSSPPTDRTPGWYPASGDRAGQHFLWALWLTSRANQSAQSQKRVRPASGGCGSATAGQGTLRASPRDGLRPPLTVRDAQYARPARWPFGAPLLNAADGTFVAKARATSESGSPVEHAEVSLLRDAAAAGIDLLTHAVVSTAEPCPMCAGALVWSGVRAVAYGTSISTLMACGIPQINVPFTQIVSKGFWQPTVAGGVRADLTDPLYRNLPPETA